jgi:hypothetical protein
LFAPVSAGIALAIESDCIVESAITDFRINPFFAVLFIEGDK